MSRDVTLDLLAFTFLALCACGGSAANNGSDPDATTGAADTDEPGSGDGSTRGEDSEGDSGSGSDPDAPDVPEARDGSRLRIEWFEPDSGPAQVTGIFDTELGIPCAFRVAADKVLRCLPTTDAKGLHFDAATGDAIPVRAVTEACMPSYLVDHDAATNLDCEARGWVVFEPGEFRTEVCSGISGGSCISTSGPDGDAPPGSGYLFLGDPVDPATFVAGDITTPAGDTRLRHRFLEAEDGARIGWDVFDTELEGPCAFGRTEAGELRCLPEAPYEALAYLEAEDAWVPFEPGNTACPPDRIGRVESPSNYSCEEATQAVYGVGDDVDEVCTTTTNGACSSWRVLGEDAPAGATFFLAGEELDPSAFVLGERGQADGDGRIVATEVVTDDGFRVASGLMDTVLGEACSFSIAADGVRRCLPQTFSSGEHYDLRAMEWAPYRRGNGDCSPAFIVSPSAAERFSCELPRTEVYAVGSTAEQVCIASAVPGGCSSWLSPSDEAPAGAALYLAGDVVDPGEFVGG